jgi:hypothetical protein
MGLKKERRTPYSVPCQTGYSILGVGFDVFLTAHCYFSQSGLGIFTIHEGATRTQNLQNYNRKIWEELITYFPFTSILISGTSKKKTLVCMRNEVNKIMQYLRLQCWYY